MLISLLPVSYTHLDVYKRQSQSYLASKAAPPPKKSYKWVPLIVFIAIVIAVYAQVVLLGVIIAALGGYIAFKAFRLSLIHI